MLVISTLSLLAAFGPLSVRISEVFVATNGPSRVCAVDLPEERSRIGEGRRWGFGYGLKPDASVPVRAGGTYELAFSGRVPNLGSTYVLYLRMLDARGENVSANVAPPQHWPYSPSSKAFYQIALPLDAPNVWQEVKRPFAVPEGVTAVQPVIAAWRGDWVECRSYSITEVKGCVRREAKDVGVRVEREERADGSMLIRAVVSDESDPPRPRALQVVLELPHDLEGWTWHRNWRTDEPITAKSSFRDDYGVGGHPVARFPFCAVSRDGIGFAFGTEFDASPFESRVVTAKGFASTVPLGLLERGGKGRSAKLEWLVFPFRGTWGFRSAAKAYYASQAGKIPVAPAGAKEGTWLWPVHTTNLPPEPDDFGLAFWEAPSTVARLPKAVAAAREKRIGVYPYTEAWGMRQALAPLPDGGHPSVPERLAELQGWASETNAKVHWFDAPRNIAAQAALNSLPVQPDGTHPFAVDKYDSWTHWWRTNSDPRLGKPNRASLCWDYTVGLDLDAIDGLYLDSVTYGFAVNFNNIRPEHLAVMDEPLVYDPEYAVPCANGMQHQVAFVKWVANMMHARGSRVFGNVFEVAHRFHATTIDIFGSEVGGWGRGGAERVKRLNTVISDAECCERRFYAYHRPIGNLLQEGNFSNPAPELPAEGITNYVEHHIFYAFYPGVCTIGGEEKPGYATWKRYFGPARQCERDRALFKRAIPLIRRLNRAGWQPETLIRCAEPNILIERYGEAGEDLLFTVRNASDKPVEAVLVPDAEIAGRLDGVDVVWHEESGIEKAGQGWRIRIAPWKTVVFVAN